MSVKIKQNQNELSLRIIIIIIINAVVGGTAVYAHEIGC